LTSHSAPLWPVLLPDPAGAFGRHDDLSRLLGLQGVTLLLGVIKDPDAEETVRLTAWLTEGTVRSRLLVALYPGCRTTTRELDHLRTAPSADAFEVKAPRAGGVTAARVSDIAQAAIVERHQLGDVGHVIGETAFTAKMGIIAVVTGAIKEDPSFEHDIGTRHGHWPHRPPGPSRHRMRGC